MHSPTLKSIKMIETTIQQYNGVASKAQIWNKLPKKMMYQNYKQVLDYFIKIKSVVIAGGMVQWVYPKEEEKMSNNQAIVYWLTSKSLLHVIRNWFKARKHSSRGEYSWQKVKK